MESVLLLIPLFFSTALVYSSVGFGGGSAYLAWLVLFQFPYETIPKTALICNLIVVAGGMVYYIKARHFSFRHIFPFIVTSIPFAYWGGSIHASKRLFLFLLAFSLAVAGLHLLFLKREPRERAAIPLKVAFGVGLPLGALLGFLSGFVGIGGGIFLAPILYFLGWGSAREIAASASFFILVNSLFGLGGQLSKGVLLPEMEWMFAFAIAVFIGGQIGSYSSVGQLSSITLQRITAFLVLFAAARIFWMFL